MINAVKYSNSEITISLLRRFQRLRSNKWNDYNVQIKSTTDGRVPLYIHTILYNPQLSCLSMQL